MNLHKLFDWKYDAWCPQVEVCESTGRLYRYNNGLRVWKDGTARFNHWFPKGEEFRVFFARHFDLDIRPASDVKGLKFRTEGGESVPSSSIQADHAKLYDHRYGHVFNVSELIFLNPDARACGAVPLVARVRNRPAEKEFYKKHEEDISLARTYYLLDQEHRNKHGNYNFFPDNPMWSDSSMCIHDWFKNPVPVAQLLANNGTDVAHVLGWFFQSKFATPAITRKLLLTKKHKFLCFEEK